MGKSLLTLLQDLPFSPCIMSLLDVQETQKSEYSPGAGGSRRGQHAGDTPAREPRIRQTSQSLDFSLVVAIRR